MSARIQLSQFSMLKKPNYFGSKQLRFTVAMEVPDPPNGSLMVAWEGCLASLGPDGQIVWTLPRTVFGGGKRKQLCWNNRAFYARVVNGLLQRYSTEDFMTPSYRMRKERPPRDETVIEA